MPTPAPIVRSEMVGGSVVSNTALTQRLYALRVAVEGLHFEAGQFVRLELDVDGVKVARPYSLVNAPGDSVIEVFFNSVPGGQLSNALSRLEKGDPVAVSRPATGFFVLDQTPPAKHLWMLATGTGLGPYLSILRTPQLWERFDQVVLVHGVPLREELVYRDILDGVMQANSGRFDVVSCVSREENPAGFTGRITDALRSGFLEQQTGLAITADSSAVMLCGNHNMINEVLALLAQRDMRRHLRHKPGHIVTEQYF